MAMPTNSEFEFRGVNHVAFVCRDMAKTVEFYRDILGMPLIKNINLPGGRGQHYFFDCGGGNALAFFWFPNSPEGVPGISAPAEMPRRGSFVSAQGSANHIAFDVPAEKFDEYLAKLEAKGIDLSPVSNHDNSPTQLSEAVTDEVYVRSVYFFDPDGICVEMAAWTQPLTPEDFDPGQRAMTAADLISA